MLQKTNQKEIKPANLSEQQKQSGINKIERLIKELLAFDPKGIMARSDSRISVLGYKLDKLLVDVFGHDTVDYKRYKGISFLDIAPINFLCGVDIIRVQEGLAVSVKKAIDTLQSIKQGFIDDMQDSELDKPSRILKAYKGLELHSQISHVCDALYKDGHYANAIEEAAKKLENMVKEKSEVSDKSGSSLMTHVFSKNNPILKCNSLLSASDKDEQEGYMHLFTGVVMGIRNPRAHENIVDDPEDALEYIAFISFLAKRLEKAMK